MKRFLLVQWADQRVTVETSPLTPADAIWLPPLVATAVRQAWLP